MDEFYKSDEERKVTTADLTRNEIVASDRCLLRPMYMRLLSAFQGFAKEEIVKATLDLYKVMHNREINLTEIEWNIIIEQLRTIIEDDAFNTFVKSKALGIIEKIILIEKDKFIVDIVQFTKSLVSIAVTNNKLFIPVFKVFAVFFPLSEDSARTFTETVNLPDLTEHVVKMNTKYIVLTIKILDIISQLLKNVPNSTIYMLTTKYLTAVEKDCNELLKTYIVINAISNAINTNDDIISHKELLDRLFDCTLSYGSNNDKKNLLNLWEKLLNYSNGQYGLNFIRKFNLFLLESNLITPIIEFYTRVLHYYTIYTFIQETELVTYFIQHSDRYTTHRKRSILLFICEYIKYSTDSETEKLIENYVIKTVFELCVCGEGNIIIFEEVLLLLKSIFDFGIRNREENVFTILKDQITGSDILTTIENFAASFEDGKDGIIKKIEEVIESYKSVFFEL